MKDKITNFIDKHSNVIIIVSVFMLVVILGYFIFGGKKKSAGGLTYIPPKIVDTEETDDASYLTVEVPEYTHEQMLKDAESLINDSLVESAESGAESSDSNAENVESKPEDHVTVDSKKNKNDSTATTTPAPTQAPTSTPTQNTASQLVAKSNQNQGSSTQGTVVDRYYTDSNGNRTSTQTDNGNVNYVVKTDKNSTLTEKDVQNIILKYMDENKTSTNTKTETKNTNNSSSKKTTSTVNQAQDSNTINVEEEDPIVYTDEPEILNNPADMEVVTGDDGDMKFEDSIIIKDINEVSDGIYVKVSDTLLETSEGYMITSLVGYQQDMVEKLEWDVSVITGWASVSDTDDDFKKYVRLDNNTAVYVTVTATFKDGLVQTSAPSLIADKTYMENSNLLETITQ